MLCTVKSRMSKHKILPRGVCRKGVRANYIVCTVCKQWVHKRCSDIQVSLKIVGFECRKCTVGEYRKEVRKEVEIIIGRKI
jgi:hypothetical protein